jgi:pimeloyl-ACP methyl ester carboxylesterase
MKKMGEVLAKRLFIYPQQENLRQIFIQRWAENNQQAYLNALRAIVGWTVEEQVSKITMPCLILAADEDYSPLDLKEALVARMPHAELVVVEDARHALPIEKPEEFNEAVGAFLKRID